MSARVCFLWHMHQPDYRNPRTGVLEMPWVALHAVKDYGDMLERARLAGFACTFNLVPSLLEQLRDWAAGSASDRVLGLIGRDPADLEQSERDLLERFVCAVQVPRMTADLPEYARLVERTRTGVRPSDVELRDMQLGFLLAWTGNRLRREPLVAELLRQGSGFQAHQRDQLLEMHRAFAAGLIDEYRQAQRDGLIEVSSTPFNHPILPLLLDIRSARVALPGLDIPAVSPDLFAEDARRQVMDALEFMQDAGFDQVRGFWPSEGSLSPATAQVLADAGLHWTASDEGVLRLSRGEHWQRGDLYRPWEFAGMRMLFRDRTLSDLIGFTYSQWDWREAVSDFRSRLEQIARQSPDGAIIPVFLDGENAWEYYEDNGEPFLGALYEALLESPLLEPATISAALEAAPRPESLEHLHSGSWIESSFSTWVGHPEKNRAWELLARVRQLQAQVDPQLKNRQALQAMLRAEGSDWFWWLGDDHPTELADLFDHHFRENLIGVCEALGAGAFAELHSPIRGGQVEPTHRPPRGCLQPEINGREDSFFEWFLAGELDLRSNASMHRDSLFERLCYGYLADGRRFAGRLVPGMDWERIAEGSVDALGIRLGALNELRIELRPGACVETDWGRAVCEEDLEFLVDPGEAGFEGPVEFALVLYAGDEVRERVPASSQAYLAGPGEYLLQAWSL